MDKLSILNDKDLLFLKDLLDDYSNIDDLKNEVNLLIERREKEKDENPNIRFNIDLFKEWRIFDSSELKVIKNNNISNMQELIDCDLDSLVGIKPSLKISLDRKRRFYNMNKESSYRK